MLKLILSLTSIFLLLPLNFHSLKLNHSLASEINNTASFFFKFMKNNQLTMAAELFHYPNEYSIEKLENEKEDVIDTLKLFKEEFGNILSLKISVSPNTVIGYGVSGASIKYWKKHSKFIFRIFEVNFEREGKGFIKISYCQINNNWELQGVDYALPESEYSKHRISEIIKIREGNSKRN